MVMMCDNNSGTKSLSKMFYQAHEQNHGSLTKVRKNAASGKKEVTGKKKELRESEFVTYTVSVHVC